MVHFAGGENLRGGDHLRPMSDLDSGGQLIAPALFRTSRAGCLVEQILKLDLAFFESRRVDVREVVGNVIKVGLLGLHSGGGGVKGA